MAHTRRDRLSMGTRTYAEVKGDAQCVAAGAAALVYDKFLMKTDDPDPAD